MELHEQHEMLCEILAKLVPVLSCDELEFLAHCCGERVDNFYPQPTNESDMFNEQMRIAA